MARISLVICDLCKAKMSDEESKEEYSLTLFSLNEPNTDAEICFKCYKSLLHRIKSKEILEVAAPKPKVTRQATQPEATEGAEQKPETPAPVETGPRPEPTEELQDNEIKIVPSNFDRKKAAKAIRDMNNGSTCLHHFKTFRDGKIVCADAPGGIEGELSGFRGCGEVLSASQYTVSKPRHFSMKA